MTLQKNVLLILLGLLLGTLLCISGVGFFTTRSSIRDLRATIMEATETHVAGELWHYFAQTERALNYMRRSVFEEPRAAIDDWREAAGELGEYMEVNPALSFLYYADAKTGDLVGVQRTPDDELVAHHTVEANGRIPQTYQIMPGGELEPFTSDVVDAGYYDPRVRPWFEAAVAGDGIIWTPPYGYPNSDLSGVSAAVAHRGPDGEVEGVFAVDLFLGDVAEFLDGLKLGKEGAVFLLQSDGSFLVDAKYRTSPEALQIRAALERQGQEGSVTKTGEFRCEECDISYLAVFEPVERPGGDTLDVAVVVPQSTFMDVVRRNAWLTVVGAVAVIGLAIGVSVFFSYRITRRLSDISDELERIGRLDLETDQDVARRRSRIHEIARFDDSVGRMKVSLRSFSRYVPRDIVRKLVAQSDEAKLGGEVREVTVKFTDLVGFTAMSEELDADGVFRELRIFLEALAKSQEKYGGITSNFTGDGTMALFNAPDDRPDHAAEAVASAIDFGARLGEINAERTARGRPALHARVGLNTAEVLVGNLGTSDRFTYTAVGDGVNIASRLEGLNKLYGTEILVGEACRKRAGERFEWRRVDRIAVVGRKRALTIFEPLGRKGEVDAARLDLRDRYEAALDAYCEGLLETALEQFAAISDRDPVAAVLEERAGRLLDTSLPESWDGTYNAPFK